MNLIKKSRKNNVWYAATALVVATNLLGFNSIAHAQLALLPSVPVSSPSVTPTISLPAIVSTVLPSNANSNSNNDNNNTHDPVSVDTTIPTPVGTVTTTTDTTPATNPTPTEESTEPTTPAVPSVYDTISPAVIKPEAPVPTVQKVAASSHSLTAEQAAAQQDLINQMMQTVIPMDPYIAKGFKPLTTNILYGISGLVGIAGLMLMFGKPAFLARHLVALFSFS